MTKWKIFYHTEEPKTATEAALNLKEFVTSDSGVIAEIIKKSTRYELQNTLGQKFLWKESEFSNVVINANLKIPVAILKSI